jgi:hypothetical protein
MKKLAIVQCGDKKIWKENPNIGPVAAKDAYTSPYFQKNKAYAQKIGDHWMVLSAKYGFLEPDTKIEKYNVSFKKKKTNPITCEELKKQVIHMRLDRFDEIIVLGGKEYLQATEEAFRDMDCTISAPFKGLPIGKRMSKLNIFLNNSCQL